MSHGHHAPELPYCRNCHFTLAAPRPIYCGHCGQETDLHPPSVREMVTEYVGHYVAFDGPFFRTLWALICLPGHLTNAYFHGARRRYVLPLRVYLSASFLFFVGSLLLPHGKLVPPEQDGPPVQIDTGDAAKPVQLRVKPGMTPAETAAEAVRLAASAAGREAPASEATASHSVKTNFNCQDKTSGACASTERTLNRWVDKAQHMTGEQWNAKLRGLAPYGMLGMQPLFAALLLAMFAGSGRKYAEHFVFSLHSHSLWFLALLAANAGVPAPWLMTGVFVHGLAAMRRVYHLSWKGALWRGTLLSIGYLLLLTLGLVLLVVLVAATA